MIFWKLGSFLISENFGDFWFVFVAFADWRFQDVLMIDVLILNFKIFVKNVHFLSKYKSSIDLTSKRKNTQNQIIKWMTQSRYSPFFIRNCEIYIKNGPFQQKTIHFYPKLAQFYLNWTKKEHFHIKKVEISSKNEIFEHRTVLYP